MSEHHREQANAQFAAAAGISLEEALKALRELAKIIKAKLEHTSAAEFMPAQLALVQQIADGDPLIAKTLADRLETDLLDGKTLSRLGAKALLDRAASGTAPGRPLAVALAFELQYARDWKSEAEKASEERTRRRASEESPYPSQTRFSQIPGASAHDRPRSSSFPRSAPTTRGVTLGAPPPAYGAPIEDAAPPASAPLREREANEYRVWFGTNREPVDQADPSRGFTGRRSREVRYGHCDVYVPESHKIGSIGSSALIRLLTWTDDRLKLRHLATVAEEQFWSAIRDQLSAVPVPARHAVVFIHGFNVSFEEAAIRAAQIGFDLGVEGAMAFFSWPSQGSVDQYPGDGESIQASEPAITDFLVDFAERSGAEAVHVIAHSMGNRGLLRAVTRIAQDAERRSGLMFENFILAAPDVDVDVFLNLAKAYGSLARRTTLYVSEKDKAVSLSRWLHGYDRVGFAPPVSVFDGIDTVNVTNIDLTMLGHGYVGEARAVLNDMHMLIFEGLPPDRRFSLAPAQTETGKRYWTVRA